MRASRRDLSLDRRADPMEKLRIRSGIERICLHRARRAPRFVRGREKIFAESFLPLPIDRRERVFMEHLDDVKPTR
jgi:hypothetical protein